MQRIIFLIVISITLYHCHADDALCYPHNATCSRQISWLNASNSDCSIKGIRNEACTNLSLKTRSTDKLGKVLLQCYLFTYGNNSYHNINLNLTFSQVKWTRLRMQYKNRHKLKNFCREINVNQKLINGANIELFYDCLWSKELQDEEFDFRYEAYDSYSETVEGKHYVFKVPRYYEIEDSMPLQNRSVFNYIDITEVPLLIFHWQKPLYNNITDFQVNVYKEDKLVFTTNVTSKPESQFHWIPYDIGLSTGKIFFTVQILHEDCKGQCTIHKSPVIFIGSSYIHTPMLICIVGSVVLLPVFLYVLYIWKHYSSSGLEHNPKVLLVYKRSMASHIQVVVALAKYLRKFCHIHAMIDEMDISLTESKDPFKWYQEAFLQANVVLVISSPTAPYKSGYEEGIYQKVDLLALRILSEKYINRSQDQKFFALLLPYCKAEDIPIECRNFKCFSLKKDWNKLLWVMRYGLQSYWFSEIDYLCYQSELPGGSSSLKRHGKFLSDAIHLAEEDILKQSMWAKNASDNLEYVPLKAEENVNNENTKVNNLPPAHNYYKAKRNQESCIALTQFPGNIDELDLSGEGKIFDNKNQHSTQTKSDSTFLDNLDL